jgi:hypothetical protein
MVLEDGQTEKLPDAFLQIVIADAPNSPEENIWTHDGGNRMILEKTI